MEAQETAAPGPDLATGLCFLGPGGQVYGRTLSVQFGDDHECLTAAPRPTRMGCLHAGSAREATVVWSDPWGGKQEEAGPGL